MGWTGPMTRRQHLLWMAWLPYEAARVEFQPPQRTDRRGPEKWRLTKEQAQKMNLEAAKLQFSGMLGVGAKPKPGGIVTKAR